MATGYSHAPAKIQKSITRRKGAGSHRALNADSRDARRLAHALQRDEKLARRGVLRARANEKYLSRIAFFRDAAQSLLESSAPGPGPTPASTPAESQAAPDPTSPFTATTLAQLVRSYLARPTADVSASTAAAFPTQHRKGRPIQISAQESARRAAVQDDVEEARSGFWMPDLCHAESLRFLSDVWDGGWSSLANVRFVRVRFAYKNVVASKNASSDSKNASSAAGAGAGEADEVEGEILDVKVTESAFPPTAAS